MHEPGPLAALPPGRGGGGSHSQGLKARQSGASSTAASPASEGTSRAAIPSEAQSSGSLSVVQ